MKINERYSIERDKHNFIVVETKETKKDGGGIGTVEVKNYYPTLELACKSVVKKQIDLSTMDTITESIKLYTDQITQAIKSSELA